MWGSSYKSLQGNLGLGQAIAFFTSRGIPVSIPLNDTQKYDLVAEINGVLKKISIKTTMHKPQFFDLENIKFSHLECNAAASSSRIKSPCGTDRKYRNGCRCEACKAAHSVSSKKYYRKELRQARYLRTGK